MDVRLDGKRALITGASSGIGEAIALQLADAGARVGINHLSRDQDAAKEIADKIRRKEGEALLLPADVSQPGQVDDMFAKIDDAWDGIDILVNNAGIDGKRAKAWEIDLDSWRRVIEVNLFGAFYCSRQALKRMIPNKSGVILGMSSVHEIVAWSGYSAYVASKSGIAMMNKTLAQEAAPYGVRVVSVAPGAVRTRINKNVWDNPQNMKDLLDKIPLGRIGETDEIARMVLVLVSDVASYVTGRSFFIDGGMSDYPLFEHGG